MKKEKSEKVVEFFTEDKFEEVDIMPLRDHEIHHNEYHLFFKKGVSVPAPRMFLPSLVTEKVIKQLPN